jgi:hypothetical protein
MGPVVDRKQRRSSGKVSANVSNIASTETPLESELTLVSMIGMNECCGRSSVIHTWPRR